MVEGSGKRLGLILIALKKIHFSWSCQALHPHCTCSSKMADQFKDFVYLSQVVQAICIDAEAQHYRRLLSTDGVLTRGTLYWQLV